ncbi:MAG: Crp/Fnr family transcriptional regulator [Candidatus Xenobia bacterium]
MKAPQGLRRLEAADHVQRLRAAPILKGLDDSAFEMLAAASYVRSFRRGELIFHEGDPGDSVFVVLNGAVRVFRITAEGAEKTLTILGEGDLLGEMALLDGLSRSASASAHEETTCVVVGRQDFSRLLDERPKVTRVLLEHLCLRLRAASDALVDLAYKDARLRLIKALLLLAERHGRKLGGQEVQITLTLTHNDLASMISSKRETVTRILQELLDESAIRIEGRTITVRDVQSFRNQC